MKTFMLLCTLVFQFIFSEAFCSTSISKPYRPQKEIPCRDCCNEEVLFVVVNRYEKLIRPLNNALYDLLEAVQQDRKDTETLELIDRIMELRKDLVSFFELDLVEMADQETV